MKTKEQLIKEFSSLENDCQKWQWVRDNQNEENLPPVSLDNDDTFISIEMEDGNCEYLQFSDYVGCTDGVEILLNAMGIRAEVV